MSAPPRVAVAVSGGLDSTALLHCTARLAARAGVEVHALHVHHGLQAGADAWMAQVAAQCRRWSRGGHPIAFHGRRIVERPAQGDSIEAWARRQRYLVLADMAIGAGCALVLLAHHRRDQAETVWLQALRGAGPAGLAAMPRMVERQGLTWGRPWLDQPREAVEAYARRWRLRFVVDPSNTDPRHARSRLRSRLWPTLLDAFGDAETTLGAVARRAHEAHVIIDEVAREDARMVTDERGLRVPAWAGLTVARQGNVLRHWLARELAGAVPESLVQRLLRELPALPTGRWPAGEAELGLHAGYLKRLIAVAAGPDTPMTIDLSRPGLHSLLPWPGSIQVEPVLQGGVPAVLLQRAELRSRQGGEQFQSHPRSIARSLKKQYQAQGVPAWRRDGPLVFAGDALVWVPGLGLDARVGSIPGEPRVQLHWQA